MLLDRHQSTVSALVQLLYWLAGAWCGVAQGYAYVAAQVCAWLGWSSLAHALGGLATWGRQGTTPTAGASLNAPVGTSWDQQASGLGGPNPEEVPSRSALTAWKDQAPWQALPSSQHATPAPAVPAGTLSERHTATQTAAASAPAAAAETGPGAGTGPGAFAPSTPAEVAPDRLEFIPLTAPFALASQHQGTNNEAPGQHQQPVSSQMQSQQHQFGKEMLPGLFAAAELLPNIVPAGVLANPPAAAAPEGLRQEHLQQAQLQQQEQPQPATLDTALDRRLSSFALDHISPTTTATTLASVAMALAPAPWAQEEGELDEGETDPTVDVGVGPLEPVEGEMDMAITNSTGSNLLPHLPPGNTQQPAADEPRWFDSLVGTQQLSNVPGHSAPVAAPVAASRVVAATPVAAVAAAPMQPAAAAAAATAMVQPAASSSKSVKFAEQGTKDQQRGPSSSSSATAAVPAAAAAVQRAPTEIEPDNSVTADQQKRKRGLFVKLRERVTGGRKQGGKV